MLRELLRPREETLGEALKAPELLASLYQQPLQSSEWYPIGLEEVKPTLVHLLVLRKAAETSFP